MALTAAQLAVKVGADIADLEKGLKQASGSVKGFASTGKTDLAGLGGAMQALSPQASMLGQAMRYGVAGGALYMGVQVAGATFELAKMGARIEDTENAFNRFFGSTGASLDNLRAATKGALSDSELMLRANQAYMLQVATSSDEMARIWAVAIGRGEKLGKTALESIDAVNIGIGRNSPQFLDNIAIVGLGEASYARYAAKLGVTADSLTELQKKQAVAADIMAMGTEGAGGATVAYARLGAALNNLKDDAAKALNEGFAPLALGIAQTLEAAREFEISPLNNMVVATQQSGAQVGPSMLQEGQDIDDYYQAQINAAQATEENRQALLSYLPTLGEVNGQYIDGVASLARYQTGLREVTTGSAQYIDRLSQGSTAGREFAATLEEITAVNQKAFDDSRMWEYNRQLREIAPSLDVAVSGVERLDVASAQLEATQWQMGVAFDSWVQSLPGQIMQVVSAIQQMRQEIVLVGDRVRGQLASMVVEGLINETQMLAFLADYRRRRAEIAPLEFVNPEEFANQMALLDAWVNKFYGDIRTGYSDAASASKRAWDQMQADAEKAAAAMRSDIEGIFQPTQGTDFTNQLDQMGMHIDTWDENARRVADIANRGMDSPWAKMFVPPADVIAQGDQAVKAWAVNWQKSFYAGMMPEQITWQSVVDAYKTQLTNRANWAQIYKDAEQVIRDQGLVFDQALLQNTLSGATGGATGAGAGAGTALTAGMPAAFNANPISAMIKTAFDADMKKQGADTLKMIGMSVGTTLVGGIKQSLTDANFLRILADAVAPGVYERIQQNESRKPGGAQ